MSQALNTFDSISQQLLRVNSRYKASGTNSNFRYVLGSNRSIDSIRAISLVRFEAMRLWVNVYDPINVINVLYAGVVPDTFIIPPGQYTALELVDAINAVSTGAFTISFDETTNRFSFFSGDVITITASSPLGIYIGLMEDIQLNNTTVEVQTSPDLSGVDPIFCQSNIVASTNAVDAEVLSGSIPLVDVISCSDVPYGYNVGWINHEIQSNLVEFTSGMTLRSIDIQITDKFGNIIDMPANDYVNLIFRIYYKNSLQ